MKNLRTRFERFLLRNRDKGIPNLMLYIVLGSGLLSLVSAFTDSLFLYSMLCFDKAAILQGQVWRLFTFVFTEHIGGGGFGLFMSLIACYFFYILGRRIELTMGTLKFNLFYFSGVLIMDIFAMIFAPNVPINFTGSEIYLHPASAIYLNMAWYLHLCMVLMFIVNHPDAQFLVLFFIPVKAWFLGIVYLVMIGMDVVSFRSLFPHNLFPLVALVNFLLFAGKDALNLFPFIRITPRPKKIKRTGTVPFRKPEPDYNHRCTICGRTDASDPQLEFRYCSRCNGYYCYCEDHINDHTHIE